MVRIEDVTDAPAEATAGSSDGVPQKRRVQFSNEVSTVENNNSGDDDEDAGEAQPERELTFDEQVDAARAQYQPSPWEKFLALAKSLFLRAIMIYFLMTFWRTNSKPAQTASSGGGAQAPASLASSNIFINGTELEMYVYISEDSKSISNFTNANLVWEQGGLMYGDWSGGPNSDGIYIHSTEVHLSKRVQNNGSVYLHTYIVPKGFSPDPTNKHLYSKSLTLHSSKRINKFKRKKYVKTHNLLTGETTTSAEDQEKAKIMSSEIVSHWHPNMTITLVADWTQWTMGAVPVPLNEYIKFIPNELKYQPILFFNDYWNLAKEYYPINETTPVLPLTLTFQPLTLFKWQLYAAQSMRNQWSASFLTGQDEQDDDEQDTLKEAFLETNHYLLGLTFVVSILHSIFEFLAFKNDIQFWNNRKSLEGLSVRSVFFNVFQSLIVLLYVMDNETNFVIKVSVFVGLLIEIWKINKVTDVKLDRQNLVMGILPRITLTDKGSYVESSTKQYDMLAFRYLSWALFPLLFCYSIYSLLYVEHKGWYSWVLGMLYGFLLTFGFIMMTPQLFINYKLKSVAHLPWRMLTYKFLNTFIDDIFAFVIKMPTMYRIGCLRDDVIFFIYLYQRYIYRIDPTRVNEFGFSAEMIDEKANSAAGGAPQIADSTSTTTTSAEPNTTSVAGSQQNGSLTQQTSPKSSKGDGASPKKNKDSGGSTAAKSPPKTKASKTKAKKDQ
ncbi:Cleft lip and palate transmembrane protein 1 [Orchesella cincta]|uniref:Cleft lip and palate transmembrane protein 1 n=1 Tax=Orchesella cincta TaxID=48709 RepID=A0A1D2NK41_ORCCI|nr:Cleft lip and palate transmembrane protein 1 [Orchesella cincta]